MNGCKGRIYQIGSYYPCFLIKNLTFLLIQPDKKETEIKGKE